MEKLRLTLLAVIFGSVFCVLGKTIIEPTTGNNTIISFTFPETVPLPEWQPLKSRSLAANPVGDSPNPSGKHYQYIQNNLTLDIKMRYLVNTSGHVKFFIRSVPQFPGQLALASRYQEGIGFYYLFVYERQAHLSTCINSRGNTTVSEAQFLQNRYLYDLRFGRLLLWLLNQGSFQDKRCLWAHLSIPIKDSSLESTYQNLEKAWEDWYRWWQPRFPQS